MCDTIFYNEIDISWFITYSLFLAGYFEKEMHKEGVEVVDKEVYPDAPAPKELVDMEVSLCTYTNWLLIG